jgi:3-oxoadipate enol-lactonase
MRYRGHNTRIIVNELTISYTDEGPDDAPAIIFIHGFPLNKSMWNAQIDALSLNYRVIAYDVRGHGNSDAGSGDFSIELFVNDLISLMDALKIEKTMLCGISMGGYIALNAIENYPKRFDALILCDTNCIADTQEIWEKRMNTIESIKNNGLENYADESLKKLFTPESFVTNKEKIAAVKTMIMENSMQSICKTIFALARRKETYSKLTDITVHVLILVGEKDQMTPPDQSMLIQKTIKGSILNIIKHAGHLSNIENSYEFNIQIEKFITSIKTEYPGKEKINHSKK